MTSQWGGILSKPVSSPVRATVAASCVRLTLVLVGEPLCPLSRTEEPLPSHTGVSPAGGGAMGRKLPRARDSVPPPGLKPSGRERGLRGGARVGSDPGSAVSGPTVPRKHTLYAPCKQGPALHGLGAPVELLENTEMLGPEEGNQPPCSYRPRLVSGQDRGSRNLTPPRTPHLRCRSWPAASGRALGTSSSARSCLHSSLPSCTG